MKITKVETFLMVSSSTPATPSDQILPPSPALIIRFCPPSPSWTPPRRQAGRPSGGLSLSDDGAPCQDAGNNPSNDFVSRNWLFVRIQTDAGIHGVGESSGWPRVVQTAIVRALPATAHFHPSACCGRPGLWPAKGGAWLGRKTSLTSWWARTRGSSSGEMSPLPSSTSPGAARWVR